MDSRQNSKAASSSTTQTEVLEPSTASADQTNNSNVSEIVLSLQFDSVRKLISGFLQTSHLLI